MVPSKAYTYTVTVPPDCPPVSLDEVKSYLKITGAAQDALIEQLTAAATDFAEDYTKRSFIDRTIKTFRDDFTSIEFELRRSPLSSVTSIKYLVDGSLVTVDDSIYYNTKETDFSRIALNDGESWPTDVDVRLQAVEIVFIAGFGEDERSVPDDIKVAIMQHVAALLENRGDCTLQEALPRASELIYNKNRIMDIKV
jgi:uncharacterized phiE125 gp8 family phage protein